MDEDYDERFDSLIQQHDEGLFKEFSVLSIEEAVDEYCEFYCPECFDCPAGCSNYDCPLFQHRSAFYIDEMADMMDD